MQTLLNDIELDIQELKCLMQAITGGTNPALRIVARRSILQMKTRLDALQALLDEVPTTIVESINEEQVTLVEPISSVEPVSVVEAVPFVEPIPAVEPIVIPLASSILAERIKPSTDLRHAISLNDSFRFTRELFDGDASRMNDVVRRLGNAPTLDKAMDIFALEIHQSEENEAVADFIELLKKYFS